jgi:hypothetical protein
MGESQKDDINGLGPPMARCHICMIKINSLFSFYSFGIQVQFAIRTKFGRKVTGAYLS